MSPQTHTWPGLQAGLLLGVIDGKPLSRLQQGVVAEPCAALWRHAAAERAQPLRGEVLLQHSTSCVGGASCIGRVISLGCGHRAPAAVLQPGCYSVERGALWRRCRACRLSVDCISLLQAGTARSHAQQHGMSSCCAPVQHHLLWTWLAGDQCSATKDRPAACRGPHKPSCPPSSYLRPQHTACCHHAMVGAWVPEGPRGWSISEPQPRSTKAGACKCSPTSHCLPRRWLYTPYAESSTRWSLSSLTAREEPRLVTACPDFVTRAAMKAATESAQAPCC